jgi:hypothetical protein
MTSLLQFAAFLLLWMCFVVAILMFIKGSDDENN